MCVWEMRGDEGGGERKREEGGTRGKGKEWKLEKEWWKKKEKNWLSCSFAFRAIVTLLFNLNETGFDITRSSTHTHSHLLFCPVCRGSWLFDNCRKERNGREERGGV